MYRCCLLAGLPRLFILAIRSSCRSFFFGFAPPPPWITRGRPLSPGPRVRARSSNNGRHNRPKYKGAGEEILPFRRRHHVPHIPVRLGPTRQEITHGVHGPRGVNRMEVKFREQLMPTCLAWTVTPHGFKVLRSPLFKATVVRTDLHSLVSDPTMSFEKYRHYGVALFFPLAPIQLAA